MKQWLWLAVFAIAPIANAQQLPPLQEFLRRLYTSSAEYAATLPSISCDESIISQRVKKGKVKWAVRIEGSMRETRTENADDPFREQHDFKTADGKRIKNLLKLQIPYFVQGGFANLMGFRHWDLMDCFEHTLSWVPDGKNVQLDVTVKPFPQEDEDTPHRKISICSAKLWQGTHWKVIANPDTGHILHNERTITPENADRYDETYFAAMDHAPQAFGSQTFWLPVKFYTEDVDDRGRMYATYSNCHRYTGELRILSGTPEMPLAQPQ